MKPSSRLWAITWPAGTLAALALWEHTHGRLPLTNLWSFLLGLAAMVVYLTAHLRG